MSTSYGGPIIRPSVIIFMGTSITATRPGDSIFDADTFCNKIGIARDYKRYVNSGIGGNNTNEMVARYETDLLQYFPGIVNIEPGPNDWSEAVPIATSESNIREMVRASLTQGSSVTLMVPLYINIPASDAGVEPWRELTRDLASELGCELFDTYAHWASLGSVERATLFLADNLHPSIEGHTRIKDRAIADNVLNIPASVLEMA